MNVGRMIPPVHRDAALAYAALGIKVFRVRRDKTPYGNCVLCSPQVRGEPNPQYIPHRPDECQCGVPTCHGFWAATTDADLINKWWAEEPDANIGAPCKLNGWAVLDIDPRNGGERSLAAVEQRVGLLPGTVMQITGGDGLHILYRSPGFDLPGVLEPGIDIKHNGYILLAPSMHSSGYRYQWPDGKFWHPETPWPTVLVPHRIAPSLIRTVAHSAAPTKFMTGLIKVVLEAREGERNSRLFWAACKAFEHASAGQIDATVAANCLMDAATHIGLDEREARQTITSGHVSSRGAA